MRKGISQALSIIVTTLVLLTAALAVISAVLGGINPLNPGGTLDTQACVTAVQSQCRGGVADQVPAPDSCFNREDSMPSDLQTQVEASDLVDQYEQSQKSFACAEA